MAATSSYRVGSQPPPNRPVRAIGQRWRRSSWIGYGSADHSGSRWEKSVAQSETGPVMIALRVPNSSSSFVSPGSRGSRGKRSSTAMSGLLGDVDRALGTVGHRQARIVFSAGWYDSVAQYRPVALVV